MKPSRIVLIIIGLLIAFLIGRYIYGRYFASSDTTSTQTTNGQVQGTQSTGSAQSSITPRSSTATTAPASSVKEWKVFINSVAKFQMLYPANWYLQETTPHLARGTFGTIVRSWTLTSYDPVETRESGDLPQGQVRMDFEISNGGSNYTLPQVGNCESPAVESCRDVTINGTKYKKAAIKSTSGARTDTYTAIDGYYIYRATVYNAAAAGEDINVVVEQILNSFSTK